MHSPSGVQAPTFGQANAQLLHEHPHFLGLAPNLVNLLLAEGFIRDFRVIKDDKQDTICVYLRYTKDQRPVISHLERVSKPGRRLYVKAKNLPRVRHGLGIAILSTSRGVMTDKQARELHLGGEHLCSVW